MYVKGSSLAQPPPRHTSRINGCTNRGRRKDEVIARNLPFTCEHCDHSFDSRAGLCTHTMLWCGEAGRQTWEEDFIVASIDGVRGPPDKRFFRVHWEGVNETGKIVRGGHAGDDTMPGEPWKPTWEPFRHLGPAQGKGSERG